MNEVDITCPYCDTEFTVNCDDDDAAVAFCPYCGEDLDANDDGEFDWDEDDEEE